MQFPVLLAGRPFTGQRAMIPGIAYQPEEKCFWTRHNRAIWAHHQAHPDGPHSYGWWDSVPGRPEARPTHARWLALYLPMVEEGTRGYLEIADSDLFSQPVPDGVVASAFANRNLYLALANYAATDAEIMTSDPYTDTADPPATARTAWRMPPRSLRILLRSSA
jgi:hypothetical protein